jgi:putative ABC transport system permease protein
MFALALRNLWAYKRRLLTSAFSVVLGISFLSGSFVFTDTLKGLFNDLFSSSVKGIDTVVRPKIGFADGAGKASATSDDGPYRGGLLIPIALVDKIARVEGVAAVEAASQGYAQVINKKGKLVGGSGPPTFGFSWINDPELASYKIFNGRAPKADNEVVLDRSVIKKTGYKIGDKVKIVSMKPIREFVLVGDATFGTSDGALGATASLFTPKIAQELLGRPGEASQLIIRAKPGVTQSAVAKSVSAALASDRASGGAPLETITGEALDKETQSFVNTVFKFINTFFNAFAFIALFVSIFVISNSFSILVKQRTRENAMLRTLGASSKQILATTFGEALAVGLLASAVGVFAGMGVAIGIRKLLEFFGGGGLPSSGLLLLPRTIIVGLVVGTLVTVISAVAPAIKASRIKPLAALQDARIDDSGYSKKRLYLGLAFLALSAAVLIFGLTKEGGDGAKIVGGAAALCLMGTIFIGPVLARPIAGALGRPWFGAVIGLFGVLMVSGSLAIVVLGIISSKPALIVNAIVGIPIGVYLVITALSSRKVEGRIARENAVRNPTRTSATALALTIGVGLVSAILVFSQSLTGTFKGALEKAIRANYVVKAGNDFGIPAEVSTRVSKLPGVVAWSGKRTEEIRFGFPLPRSRQIAAVDPEGFLKVFDVGRITGNFADLSKPDTIAIAEESAKAQNYRLGDTISGSFRTGANAKLTIVAFYKNTEGWNKEAFNRTYYVTSEATMSTYVPSSVKEFIYVRTDGRDNKGFQKAAETALRDYPTADLQKKASFVNESIGQLDQFLSVVYALLMLAILIAILGIANTLRLAILERTREIGLLRAVGMSRQQMKDSIRWEAIVVATFGAVIGLVIGTGFGSALVHVLGKDGSVKLTVPWPFLFGLTLLASLVGLYAARKPAKAAAKLNILQAIATE